MKQEKKEFNKAEVEVIRFEKTDVISTSNTVIPGPHATSGDEPMGQEEGEW